MSFRIKRQGGRQQVPRISDAEWIIMKVLWRRSPATAKQVVEALAGETDWKPKTIHTLLARLVQKGVVSAEKQGREYHFKAALMESQCRLAASRSFLEKVFDGEIAPFLACFLQSKKLSRQELDELKRILEEKQP